MARVFVGTGQVDTSNGTLGGTLSGRLSKRELMLFRRLAQERGLVVSYRELADAIWNDDRTDARRVMVLVQRLRKKIEPNPADARFVLTVLRRGYRLAPDEITPSAQPLPRIEPTGAEGPDAAPAPAPDLPELFGRATERALIEEWLFRRHGRWLTLTGVGGVGKSALLDWAYARARAAGLPCRRVSLRDVQSADGVLERLAHAGHVPLPPGLMAEPLLASALRARDGLWLLDDLASLDDDARSTIDRIFAPLHRVRVLASRRQPLQTLDEAVLPISPLDAEAAAAMYRSLAPDAVLPEPAHLPRLPLWVKLAVTSRVNDEPPQVSEAALVDAAIDRAPSSAALGQLGWHPGEAQGDILMALLEISPDDLAAWRRHGLIELFGDGRVRVHPVIRSALRARSARTDRMGQGRRRQLERLVAYVRGPAVRDFEHHARDVRQRLLDYLDLLLAWVRGLRPDQIDIVLDTLPMLVRVVIGSGRERLWAEALSRIADRMDQRQLPVPAARLRLAIADISDRLSPADQKLEFLLRIQPDVLQPADRALLHVHLAISHLIVGDTPAAEEVLRRVAERHDDLAPPLRARYQLARSSLLRRLDRYDEAVTAARDAVALVRTAAPTLETQALLGLTSALQDGGFTQEAWPVLHELERAAERWADHAALATCLRQQAQQAMLAHQTGSALELAERALALEYPGSSNYAYALYTAAILNRKRGAFARSLNLLDEALTEAREQHMPHLVPLILDSQGNALLRKGDVSGALEHYERALAATLALGGERDAKRIHSNIAYAHWLTGDLASALKHQELGRDHEAMHVGWRAYWEWRQAAIAFARGRPQSACASLLRASDHALTLGSIELACEAATLAASWLDELGQPDQARAICEKVCLTPDSSPLLRRLPLHLREAIQRPAEPELRATIALIQRALEHSALTDHIEKMGELKH